MADIKELMKELKVDAVPRDPATMALVITIIEAVLKYGPQAVHVLSELLSGGDQPTADEIRELLIDKDPADYFEG